jgi:hypothetical protein
MTLCSCGPARTFQDCRHHLSEPWGNNRVTNLMLAG